MASSTDTVVAAMLAQMNACRHSGLAVHERLRNDNRLAWLRSQRISSDEINSMGGLVAYWNNAETFRQQRIISLIAAREQQLRDYPGAFRWWMHEARKARKHEQELRAASAPKPVSLVDVADLVSAHILARSTVAA